MLSALFRYEKDKVVNSHKWILPLVLLVAYIGMAYSVGPQEILSSFAMSSLVVFGLMLSAGVMYDDINYQMIEQTILVKMRKKERFYLGKVLLMAGLGLLFAVISVGIPLLVHVRSGFSFFERSIVWSDVWSGFGLFWLTGMCGGMAGLLANHRIMRKRELAVLLSIFFGLTTVVKGGINEELFFGPWLTWLLPPVYDVSAAYCADAYFCLAASVPYILWLAGYTVLEIIVYVCVMAKRGIE